MANAKRIYKQLKDSLLGTKSHELLVFCFFLAVSFGFWLLQALNDTLDREVQVGLEMANIPPDVVIIDSLPSTISVTIQDKGLALARHSISSIFRPNRAKIDFSKYDTGKSEAEVYISASDMQRTVGRIFIASTKILSFRPDTLHFSYNHGLSRTLPVKLAGTVKTTPQNYIQNFRVEPDSVRVFAPQAILDTMQAVYTEAFVLDGLHDHGNFQISMRQQKFMKYEPEQVSIKVDVGYYTEKTLRVPVIGLNFPAEKKLRTFPAEVSVTFKVESGRYHQVTAEDFVLATTYEELLTNPESKLSLHIKTVPQGVSDVRISPKEVDYLIEQVAYVQ
ncbi:MAG: YbbR-like domain-containing protein [Bacteroidaceae bacterium]|nr:YbbR-like domain-containing protein [Bacteroidaceae bacterium]